MPKDQSDPPPTTRARQPKNGFWRGLRDKTATNIAIAGLVIIAVWIVTFTSLRTERLARQDLNRQQAVELVSALEAHVTNVFGYADTYLKAARRVYLRHQSLEELQNFLDAVPPNPSILSHVTVIDRSGNPIFISTGDEIGAGVNVTDRDYFKYEAATPGDELYVSKPARGRNSGIVTVRLARRIEALPDQFDGLIFTAIRLDKLTEPFQPFELGRNSAVGLIGFDHDVRVWSEGGHTHGSISAADWNIWQILAQAPSGFTTEPNPLDGIPRDYAYLRLSGYPLLAVIGVAQMDTMSGMALLGWYPFTLALFVTVVIIVLTVAILRDMRLMRVLEREVTVRRRAETKAIHATEMKSAFLATMSHEIRTPINAIMGLFELIEGADVPDRQKRQARAGQAAANNLFKQLTNVLDASRLEAKSMELTLRHEPLAPMIASLSQLLEAAIQASGKPIKAVVKIDAGVPKTLLMDRRRVEQIVLNFIDNAVKFTASGRIDLKAAVEDSGGARMLTLSVCDTGPGISPQDQKRIFIPFSQLDSAITRRAGGTGLGLSICQDLATLMQAKLRIDSQTGRGSCFVLMLPIE